MLTNPRADRLAAQLGLDVDQIPICVLCLSFVSSSLESDDAPQIRGTTVRVTPILWDEGLDLPVRIALEEAAARGVPDAQAALADIRERGPRTTIARAVVRLLARQLTLRSRASLN